MSLIQMSIQGAAIIAVTAAARALALNTLPKKTFCVLWQIAMVRLLIPYSLPCGLSIYSIYSRLCPNTPTAPTAESGITSVLHGTSTSALSSFTASPEPASAAPIPIAGPETIVWIIGMLTAASYFAVSYFTWRKKFAESLPVQNIFCDNWLSEHRTLRRISIRVSDQISSPLTYGVFRPVILMPKNTDWDNTDVLKYVLTHEYVHIKRLDSLFKLLLTVSLCVHWFNPLVWLMYFIANRDIELSCDEKVVRMLDSEKTSYAMALIQMEEQKTSSYPLSSSFSRNALKERIIAIMKFKKISPIAAATAIFLAAGTTVAFATNTLPDTSNDSLLYPGTASKDILSPSDSTTAYSAPDIEWWTYDEYAKWLEQEKINLEAMIGQKAWTNTRGDFIWTREIVDETIALYEQILQDIKNGALISKSVDGSDDLVISSGVYESPAAPLDFEEYTKFGLTWDSAANILYYKGQRVRYFFDGVDMGDDGMAIKIEYADSEKKGDIDVHTVRERIDNGDGSCDPMGPLTGLEPYSEEEFKARKFIPSVLSAVTIQDEITDSGFDYAFSYYPEAMTLQEATVTDGTGFGTTFEEIFSKYKPYGITYEEAKDASGAGNVYYNGKLVHIFSDITPAGGAFSFTSSKKSGINVRTVYQNNELIGVEPTIE